MLSRTLVQRTPAVINFRNTMGQHELDSLAIICMERAYGNQAIVNSIDNKTDIFGQLFLLTRLR